MTTEQFWLNGAFVGPEEARVSPLDRAFLMADAIYEVVRIHNGTPFLAGAHYDRMAFGLSELGIRVPFDREGFGRLLQEMAARNGVQSGLAYLQVSRGAAPRSHLLPQDVEPTVFGFANCPPMPTWRDYPDGVKAITVPDERWARCDLKTTMLLPNSLAKQKAHDAGAFEAIFVGTHGTVREGSSTGLIAAQGGTLFTHPLTRRILPSITRAAVLEIAAEEGIPAEERKFGVEELLAADEVMLLGSNTDVCPAVEIDGNAIGAGRPGPLAGRLLKRLREKMESETASDPGFALAM